MISQFITPILGAGALQFAFEKATIEGKITIGVLVIVSLFSWSVIITKIFQLVRAGRATRNFFTSYRQTRDPLELHRRGVSFEGAPAYELYESGVEELQFQLTKHPIVLKGQSKITQAGFDSVRVS